MSGYELKRKPGMTSIHAAYANNNRRSIREEQEFELITPALISELENKIKKLIRNVELFPANNVESTLKKAREIEEKIAEIIKTMFSQIKKEAACAIICNQSKKYGPKAKCLASRDVDILLFRLGEVEETLRKYADRVIKMKAFKALSDMSAKDRKSQTTHKNAIKCPRASRLSKNEDKKCPSKDISQPKEVKTNKTEKTDKKKGKGK